MQDIEISRKYYRLAAPVTEEFVRTALTFWPVADIVFLNAGRERKFTQVCAIKALSSGREVCRMQFS